MIHYGTNIYLNSLHTYTSHLLRKNNKLIYYYNNKIANKFHNKKQNLDCCCQMNHYCVCQSHVILLTPGQVMIM